MAMRKRIELFVALLLLLVTGFLVIRFIATRPPNPETGDTDALLSFALSDRFGAVDTERQQVYIESLYRRMSEMEESQAEQVGQVWQRRINESSEDAMRQFAIAMIAQTAHKYVSLPPAERQAWLKANKNTIGLSTSSSGAVGRQGGIEEDASSTESAMGMAGFLKGSSGQQRAEIGILLGDLQKMQNQ